MRDDTGAVSPRHAPRKRIAISEVFALLEELNRKAHSAMRVHGDTARHSGRVASSNYHLGRHDGYSDAAALLQALLDWNEETTA